MLSLLSLFLFATPAHTSPMTGKWITPDKSVVEVMPCSSGSTLCLKIAGFGDPHVPKTDTKNPDQSLRSRALCGLTIGMGFEPDGEDQAKGGKLYDPESGHTYSGQIKLDGKDTLKLHGFILVSLLGRTETWQRATGKTISCHDLS